LKKPVGLRFVRHDAGSLLLLAHTVAGTSLLVAADSPVDLDACKLDVDAVAVGSAAAAPDVALTLASVFLAVPSIVSFFL
jgi:hypothetical protein